MKKKLTILTLVLLAAVAISGVASAGLVPMSWGFPVLIQKASLTGLQTSAATAHDIETANIDFSGFGGSIFGSAFPTIGQTADQGQTLTTLDFANQCQSSYFAYPFISIGGSPIPSLGLL
ncbi:MAG TPA: hypothetical protein VMC84_09095 [Methanocella sp.]|uniref:hypothetical protein n=1 Tax=Methanocella sp. TaxID=2052833 RepID=UPI002C1AC43E|nr:hypothetical protein [Methanocella sp.]HTY91318.1 hypothetical protein [Methanocella sp.]